MSRDRNPLFPAQASNDFPVSKIIIVIFGLFTAVTIGRSLVHLFFPDGGANSIASIIQFDGEPDPDKVIYNIFALWGLAQLAMGVMYLIVIIRYRNLIPLMWVFVLVEYAMRLVIGHVLKPLGDQYFMHTAPGEIGNYIFVPFSIIMLILSCYSSARR